MDVILALLAPLTAGALIYALRPGTRATLALVAAGLVGLMAVPILRLTSEPPVIGPEVAAPPGQSRLAMHVRLEVTVRVEGTPVTGSVVQEIALRAELPRRDPSEPHTYQVRHRGEALVLELPGRPTLAVVMRMPDSSDYSPLFLDACGLVPSAAEGASAFIDRVRQFEGACAVPHGELPVMLAIGDRRDPTSIEVADPADFAATFGAGVEFAGATVRLTDAPVSATIVTQLPWLFWSGPPANGGDRTLRKLGLAVALRRSVFVAGG